MIIGDSAEQRLIQELKDRGNNILPSEKGSGSVNAGISLMSEFKIHIDPGSKNLIKEFNNYSWLDKKGKTMPVDNWNHGIDSARYFVYRMVRNPHHGKYYIS